MKLTGKPKAVADETAMTRIDSGLGLGKVSLTTDTSIGVQAQPDMSDSFPQRYISEKLSGINHKSLLQITHGDHGEE